MPLWYLIDNDRRITNEVPELQYFLRETMHSLADGPGARARRPAAAGHAGRRIEQARERRRLCNAETRLIEAGKR